MPARPKRKRTVRRERPAFVGHWEILDGEDIDAEAFFASPAEIAFDERGHGGSFLVCEMRAEIDWRQHDDRTVEFTFDGSDEEERIFGRGRGWLDDGGRMTITLWIHQGETLNLIAAPMR